MIVSTRWNPVIIYSGETTFLSRKVAQAQVILDKVLIGSSSGKYKLLQEWRTSFGELVIMFRRHRAVPCLIIVIEQGTRFGVISLLNLINCLLLGKGKERWELWTIASILSDCMYVAYAHVSRSCNRPVDCVAKNKIRIMPCWLVFSVAPWWCFNECSYYKNNKMTWG